MPLPVNTQPTRFTLPADPSLVKRDCSVINRLREAAPDIKKIAVIALKVIFSAILIRHNQTLFCTGVLFSVLLPENSIRYLQNISVAAKGLSLVGAAIAVVGAGMAFPFTANAVCLFSGASMGLELTDYYLKEFERLQEELCTTPV